MWQSEDPSILIGDIYDAALDRSLWVSVLEKCARFVDGSAAALFAKDAASKSGNMAYYYGIDPYFVRLYFDKMAKFDPPAGGHYSTAIGEEVSVADILPYEEFIETRTYPGWVHPQGIVDTLNVALDKTATSSSFFAIFRNKDHGPVDDQTRRRMRLIVPHVRRSALIGKAIDLKAEETATFVDTLDRIRDSMLLVDASGRILHSNVSGHELLAEGSLFYAKNGELALTDADAHQTLRNVLLAADKGYAAVGTKGIAVPLMACGGDRYVAYVLPLTSGARRQAGAAYAAVAAVFVHKAALDTPSPPELIAKSYKLSPTELRVLLAIVQVGGVPETAKALAIAESTVKTHLRRLFNKTGASRQADLVRLVAAFSTSLVHP
jgi:DNA-binding CsgD family transcriptional regulator